MSQFERQEKSRRKHQPFNSGASRAVPPPPVQRPGWKGPSFIKRTPKTSRPAQSPTPTAEPSIQAQLLPVELQQLLLNIFRTTFPISQDLDSLKPVLQQIKTALFERDFESAFGNEEWREAYAVRWSPSRVLGYVNLIAWAVEEYQGEEWVRSLLGDCPKSKTPPRVVCLGGGAAEVMAFGALVRLLRPESGGKAAGVEGIGEALEKLNVDEGRGREDSLLLDLHLVDTASWESVVLKLHAGLTMPPALSKYASASARASNASFIYPEAMEVAFTQADVLMLDKERLGGIIGNGPVMITLFFALNELYTTDVAATTKFLYELSIACPQNALLFIVDSPGSYSEAAIGKAEQGEKERKKYPMHWLMDHALLGNVKGEKVESAMWEKLLVDESRWYRLEETLKYPISLENMRFQIHLFRRL
jgi:25S rRNA (uracil2843-N3)-methyltransferase